MDKVETERTNEDLAIGKNSGTYWSATVDDINFNDVVTLYQSDSSVEH